MPRANVSLAVTRETTFSSDCLLSLNVTVMITVILSPEIMKKTLGFFFIPLAALGSLTLPHWLHPHAATLPTATVTTAPVAMPLVATGQAVAAGVRGRLWQLYVVPGQHVRRGEVLAKMASTLPTQGTAPAALGFEYVVAPTDGTIAATPTETGTYLAATETVLLLQPTE